MSHVLLSALLGAAGRPERIVCGVNPDPRAKTRALPRPAGSRRSPRPPRSANGAGLRFPVCGRASATRRAGRISSNLPESIAGPGSAQFSTSQLGHTAGFPTPATPSPPGNRAIQAVPGAAALPRPPARRDLSLLGTTGAAATRSPAAVPTPASNIPTGGCDGRRICRTMPAARSFRPAWPG